MRRSVASAMALDVELPAEAAQILDAYPNGGTLALVNGTGRS